MLFNIFELLHRTFLMRGRRQLVSCSWLRVADQSFTRNKHIKRQLSTKSDWNIRMAAAAKDKKNKRVALQCFELEKSDFLGKLIDVPVTGKIPTWLKGSLYRNGSGLYQIGGMSWKHAFDGFAVLHRWTIQNGKVSYLSRILDSDQYVKSVKLNRLVGPAFGSSFPDPCRSIFWRFFSHFVPAPPPTSDNTAVSIVEFGDRLFALTETSLINEIDPETLLRKQKVRITDVLAVHMGTAHPHMEKDGTMYYYGTNMKFRQAYNFVRVPPKPEPEFPFAGAEVIACIPSRWKMNISYTHSFGMTEHYFVHLEQPYAINFPRILTLNMRCSTIAESIICFRGQPIDIHIISKTTGKRVPIYFKAPFGFVFHFVNCYEDSGFVVCDVALYQQNDIIHSLYMDKIYSEETNHGPAPHFARYVLPLSLEGAKVGENLVTLPGTTATAVLRKGTKNILDVTFDKVFGDSMLELPRINYNFNGQKYRYAYGSTVFRRSDPMLVKLDLEEKKVHEWKVNETHIVGEPVFIPAPEAVAEDDVAAAIVVLCTAPSYQQAPQSNKCLEDVTKILEDCITKAGLQYDNFVWFTTNGTSVRSQAPANPDTYKTQICNAQQQIGSCTFQQLEPVMNSTACVGTSPSTSQQAVVGNQLAAIFGTYDLKCMHPCRNTLPGDLRKCYSDNGLDPTLFLSNSTNGAVIGSTQEQVTSFCAAKDALIKCMNTAVDACPESAQILRAMDLDVPSFQKAVTVLCNHPEVYLPGLKCFAESTPDVDRCKEVEAQSFIQLDSLARAGNWSQERFNQESCLIYINQTECDLNAWSKKSHEACTEAVIGLRRELECTLIPTQCNFDPKQINQVEHACHPEKFKAEARKNPVTGPAAVSG